MGAVGENPNAFESCPACPVISRPHGEDSEAIFLTLRRRGGIHEPLTQIGVYRVVKDAFHRARIAKPVYPHLLRHSWMTEMLRSGMNPIQLAQILGHSSLTMIQAVYSHLSPVDAYEAVLRTYREEEDG